MRAIAPHFFQILDHPDWRQRLDFSYLNVQVCKRLKLFCLDCNSSILRASCDEKGTVKSERLKLGKHGFFPVTFKPTPLESLIFNCSARLNQVRSVGFYFNKKLPYLEAMFQDS